MKWDIRGYPWNQPNCIPTYTNSSRVISKRNILGCPITIIISLHIPKQLFFPNLYLDISISGCPWISQNKSGYEGIAFPDGRSDYEGHLPQEATKELQILFMGIVHKTTWKKAFILLLCDFVWGELSPNISSLEDETKSALILICNEKKNQIFMWQYKLDEIFNLTFRRK